jgi:alkaline phosphatase D
MTHRILLSIFSLIFCQSLLSQISWGPLLGYVENREAKIKAGFGKNKKAALEANLVYWEKGNTSKMTAIKGKLCSDPEALYSVIEYTLQELKMNTTYEYSIEWNKKKITPIATFTTKFDWWQKNLPAPDFSFILASCFYINDSIYDRVGKPYGKDRSILTNMANQKVDFMIWGGDNAYLRDPDYTTNSGLNYRYEKNHSTPEFQKLFSARPNFALWDDHDFGPNDGDKTYELKQSTLALFKTYWANKTYGEEDNNGIYGRYTWYDCEFFIIDDRYHRSPNQVMDSIDGKVNSEKVYLGEKQLAWLKNGLLNSKATFKFIVNGNQVLNPRCDYECFRQYSYELRDLLKHIKNNKVDGVLFLSGDRHHSEIIKLENIVSYPLYDITSSAATSGTHELASNEKNNPYRVANTHVGENNFSILNISGKKNERILKIDVINKDGIVKSTYQIPEKELKAK